MTDPVYPMATYMSSGSISASQKFDLPIYEASSRMYERRNFQHEFLQDYYIGQDVIEACLLLRGLLFGIDVFILTLIRDPNP